MRRFFKRNILSFLLVLTMLLLLPGSVFGMENERIILFQSLIEVNQDATMQVTENIKVHAEGKQIKRGIYRDFPTKYRDRFGNKVVVDFNIIQVQRDGNPEPYHLENQTNGVRIYIGDSDYYLTPGDYTYTINYLTNRQFGFFKDYDELYWNVTGNGWIFPIENALAIVSLPKTVSTELIGVYGYTGPSGSKAQDFRSSIDQGNKIYFFTTNPLGEHEGLTIAVTWPKGLVREPTVAEKTGYLIQDNRGLLIGLAGLILIIGYYLIVWFLVGKDPKKGTVIPQYTPPGNYSPAAMRYITRMDFDHKTFAAALINMAVKGFLKINQNRSTYTLERGAANETVLTPDERVIAARLKLHLQKKIKLTNENHTMISNALKALQHKLKESYEKSYFLTNIVYFIIGLVLSVVIILISGFIGPNIDNVAVIGISIWLTIWSFGVVMLLQTVINSWRTSGGGGIFSALFITLFAIPFLIGEIVGIIVFVTLTSFILLLLLLALVFINILFYHLLKAPTVKGRLILDQFEGFKLYLTVAEKERLNMLNPPEKTPELFEKYLPYALALDVEQEWSEQFADVFKNLNEADSQYSPLWYSGSGWSRIQTAGFVSGLAGSLSSAISSSSTAPGSSSGSSGSSGGGGGGGGGGGW